MWADSVWGFIAAGLGCLLTMLTLKQKSKLRPWLIRAAAACFVIAAMIYTFGSDKDETGTSITAQGTQSVGQQNAQTITNNFNSFASNSGLQSSNSVSTAILSIECHQERNSEVHIPGGIWNEMPLVFSGHDKIDGLWKITTQTWATDPVTHETTVTFIGGTVYKCDISNFLDVPILDVNLTFSVQFIQPTIRPDGSMGTDNTSLNYILTRSSNILEIDPSTKSKYVFYIYNMSDYVAEVKLPPSATYITISNKIPQAATFLRPVTDSPFSSDQNITFFPSAKHDVHRN